MTQCYNIHPSHPQQRLLNHTADMVNKGALVVYPTDCSYALGCHMGDKKALQRVCQLRQLSAKHHFTILCSDLSSLGTYAQVDNQAYRLIKSLIPGPYTFILKATKEIPSRILHPKAKTIGLRVPNNPITLGLIEAMGEPLLSTTLIMPDEEMPLYDPDDIQERLSGRVDLIVNGGYGGLDVTTVIDLTCTPPELVRQGAGEVAQL